jgi:Mrp family chromosome partitioning ATPase
VGGLLFNVAADRTRKRDLQSAIKALTTVDASAAGFALNMVAGGATDPYRYGYYRYEQTKETTRTGRRAKERARTR